MIKYFEVNSFDEHYNNNIIPINNNSSLIKTASYYSPDLEKLINSFDRTPEYYYVLINAVGSLQKWGFNKNSDGFPSEGLSHVSTRSDMGDSTRDYGFKTFEYYGFLYQHHINKNPLNSFGKVIVSHWNPYLERIELIVGIDKKKAPDIINSIENGDNVSVSMGSKVKYDVCSICANKASQRSAYCQHLKNYLRTIVTKELASKWSKELGKRIVEGSFVGALNPYPKFFDISKVYVPADRTAFVLGKVASSNYAASGLDLAEAYNVTDEDVDKMAALSKRSEMNKEIGGDNLSVDGAVIAVKKDSRLQKVLDESIMNSVYSEPILPNHVLDHLACNFSVPDIFSTMLGLGITPKPVETQRIILIAIKRPDMANYLNDNNMCFDNESTITEPITTPETPFNDGIAKLLSQYIEKRSCFPSFLEQRMQSNITKTANILDQGYDDGKLVRTTSIPTELKVLGSLAAIYAGLQMRSKGISPAQIADTFLSHTWLRNLIGGGIMLNIMNNMIGRRDAIDPYISRPAKDYENILQDTNFSGHLQKYSSLNNSLGLGLAAGAIVLPSAYLVNSYNQKSLAEKGKSLFPGAGIKPLPASAAAAGLTTLIANTNVKDLIKKVVSR